MIATLAVLLFAVYLKWLPALSLTNEVKSFYDLLRIYAMPVVTLTFGVSAQMIRMTRAAVVETLNTPYVEMALLKGASRPRLVLRHALAQCAWPHRQLGRALAVLFARRRHHRGDDLQLSRHRTS